MFPFGNIHRPKISRNSKSCSTITTHCEVSNLLIICAKRSGMNIYVLQPCRKESRRSSILKCYMLLLGQHTCVLEFYWEDVWTLFLTTSFAELKHKIQSELAYRIYHCQRHNKAHMCRSFWGRFLGLTGSDVLKLQERGCVRFYPSVFLERMRFPLKFQDTLRPFLRHYKPHTSVVQPWERFPAISLLWRLEHISLQAIRITK